MDNQKQAGMYNLDDVREYFEFKIKGHVYRFRYLTTDEIEKMQKVESTDEAASREYMFSFISKVDETSPDFKDIQNEITSAQWKMFRNMIQTEFSGS
ncbi:MAG: hypothetical protein ACEQR7_10085 [Agathobacter rectalis]